MPLLLAHSNEMHSPGLMIRRKSLLRQNSLAFSSTAPQVPMEILDGIIECYVIELYPLMTTLAIESQKMVFARYIMPCTLVSKDFRHLVLRSFFRSLSMGTSDDFRALVGFLEQIDSQYHKQGWSGGFSWVRFVLEWFAAFCCLNVAHIFRSLSAPSFLIASNVKELKRLPSLHNLHVDFSHAGLTLQRSCLGQFFKSLGAHKIVLKLTSLMLTNLPRIDEDLLRMVAFELPGLIELHLSSADSLDLDCCPNCYEDSLSRIIHSPIPEMYTDAKTLAVSSVLWGWKRLPAHPSSTGKKKAFGKALVPLANLSRLFLGIYLSPSGMLDSHMVHGKKDSLKPNTVEAVYDCVRCARFIKSTKEHELVASLIIGRYLESLAEIGWSSCFNAKDAFHGCKSNDENNVLEASLEHESEAGIAVSEALITRRKYDCRNHHLKTTLNIRKMCGRIKVTRVL